MRWSYVFVIFISSFTGLFAQVEVPHWDFDTTVIRLGEPITVTFKATVHKDSAYTFPGYERWEGNNFVIIEQDSAVKKSGKNHLELHQQLTVTSFDTGFAVLEPIIWNYGGEAFQSEAVMVEVEWVMIEEGQSLYDIKDILWVQRPWYFYVLLAFFIGAIIVGFIYIFRWWKKRSAKTSGVPEIIKTPFEIAMEKLGDLRATNIWEEEKYGLFFLELTTILRQNIERTHGIRAMEATLDELMVRLDDLPVSDEELQKMKFFFQQSELIKYAKQTPGRASKEIYLKEVEAYLNLIQPPKTTETHV
jgi:hypothetical protein